MSEIDNDIESTKLQIQNLNANIKEFVSDIKVDDMDLNYNRLSSMGQEGLRLRVELMKLRALKARYSI